MSIRTAFIRKRNNNYNLYVEYIDENNKIKQKSIAKYTNKKDADKHLIEIKNSINNNKYIISKDITFVDRCYKYMKENYIDASPTTVASRESYIKKNIEPFFKNTKLSDITPSMLQSFANHLYNKHSYESFKVRYGFARAVLRESYRLREIPENICDFVKLPSNNKDKEQVSQVYTREEVKYLIDNIQDKPFALPILLMLTLGLRVGEATGLRWEDINFEKNTINIRQILIYIPGQGIIFKGPKTKDSKRTLSVPSQMMDLLRSWKAEYDTFSDRLEYPGIVCLNTNYLPYTQRTLYKAFNIFLEKINLRKVRLHDLRHTNATMMLLGGTDMKTVSKRLGHTDIKISMNRYSHVLEEMDQQASENISNIMFE